MKKMWALKKNEDNSIIICNSNYFTFCGKAKKYLAQEDIQATQKLKEDLGTISYSMEAKAQFRALHNTIFSKFQVIQGTVPDENKSTDITGFVFSNENSGVYRYLWQTRPTEVKK